MGIISCYFPNPLHHSPLVLSSKRNTHVKTAMACMQQGDRKENPKQPNISISAVVSEFVSSLKAEVPQQSLNPLGTFCIAVLGAQYTAAIASLQEELQKEREENEKLANKLKHAVIYVQRLEAEVDKAEHVKKKDEEILESLKLSRVRISLMGLEIEDNEKNLRTLEYLLARKDVEMNGLRRAYAESREDLEKSRHEAFEFAEQIQQLQHLCSELEARVSDIQSGKEEEEGPAEDIQDISRN